MAFQSHSAPHHDPEGTEPPKEVPHNTSPSAPEETPQTPEKREQALRRTLFSMAVATLLYGVFFGYGFAIGFVLLLLVHEMGHVVMLKLLGYRATTPVFIPFVGAIIGMQDPPRDAQTEALVAYGGPFLGAMGAYAVYMLAHAASSPFLLNLAFIGFLINLFNLIPVSPMDGGRIATAISRWLWIPGILFLIFLFFTIWNPLILIILGLGIYRAYQSLLRPREELEKAGYYAIEPGVRLLVSLAYFGLILFIGHLTWVSYQQLT